MRLGQLMPLLVLAGIGWHSQATVLRTMKVVANLKENFVVQQQLSVIVQSIQLDTLSESGYTVPTDPAEVQRLIRKLVVSKYGADTSLDPWGTPYSIRKQGNRYTVMSAGADRRWGTEDDASVAFDMAPGESSLADR